MQLFVKTLDGKTLIFDFDASDTAEHVKLKIQNLENTPVEEQRLVYFLDFFLPFYSTFSFKDLCWCTAPRWKHFG